MAMRRLLFTTAILLAGCNAGLAQVSTMGTTAMGLSSTPGTIVPTRTFGTAGWVLTTIGWSVRDGPVRPATVRCGAARHRRNRVGSDGHHDRAPSVASRDVTDRRGSLCQWVGPVDHGSHFPGFDQILQGNQVVAVLCLDGRARLLANDHRGEHRPHGPAELAVGMPAAVRDQGPAGSERASRAA